jgi:hypothetical protein
MFSDDADVRRESRYFLSTCARPPVTFVSRPEVADKLTHEGRYHRWMVDELAKGNVCALEAWYVIFSI